MNSDLCFVGQDGAVVESARPNRCEVLMGPQHSKLIVLSSYMHGCEFEPLGRIDVDPFSPSPLIPEIIVHGYYTSGESAAPPSPNT